MYDAMNWYYLWSHRRGDIFDTNFIGVPRAAAEVFPQQSMKSA